MGPGAEKLQSVGRYEDEESVGDGVVWRPGLG